MRIRLFLALGSVSFVAAGFGIEACGGSSDVATSAQDSGGEAAATETGPVDSGVDAADTAPPCDPNKDFFAEIKDASIADGASTTGICVGCTKSKCKADVSKCAADCTCQGIAGKALDCYAKSQNLFACASQFGNVPKATRDIGIALFGCIQGECKQECAADQFDGGQ